MGWTAGHFPLYSLLLHNLTSKYSVCVLWGGFFLFTFSFQCLPPLLLNSFGRCQIFIILTTISICFLKIAKCRKQTSNSTANSIQSQVSVLEQVFTKLLIIKRVIKSCNHIYIYIYNVTVNTLVSSVQLQNSLFCFIKNFPSPPRYYVNLRTILMIS